MNPAVADKTTKALVTATRNDAVNSGIQLDTSTGQLAPGLDIGSNAPGGYNYQRNVAPAVAPLVSGLVVSAKQELLKGLIKQAMFDAQERYNKAKYAYQKRQRQFNLDQASRTRARYAKQDAMQEASIAAAKTPLAQNTPDGVVVAKSRPANSGGNASPQQSKGSGNLVITGSPQYGSGGIQGGSLNLFQ